MTPTHLTTAVAALAATAGLGAGLVLADVLAPAPEPVIESITIIPACTDKAVSA